MIQLRTSPPIIYKIIICKKFANFAKFANPNHTGLEVVPALPDEVRVRAADALHRRGEGRARLGVPRLRLCRLRGEAREQASVTGLVLGGSEAKFCK